MKSVTQNLVTIMVNQAISNKTIRDMAIKKLDNQVYKTILSDPLLFFHEEKLDRYYFVSSVIRQVSKCLDNGFVSKHVARKMVNWTFLKSLTTYFSSKIS